MMEPGAQIGRYTLRRRLGAGMAGEVWAAHHAEIDVEVAVKILRDVAHAAVQREVRALASLRHPGIVFPYDHGDSDAGPWIAMELARAGSLADQPPAGWPAVRRTALQLLDALAHAHAAGIIHRDIKGANVLVFPGEGVKLSDFSIASPRQGPAAEARVGSLVTMAPEQIQGELDDQGPWTDLYALGCLLFERLTGRPPFTGPDVARQRLTQALPPLPWPAVDAWIRWLTARDPTGRPRCVAEALERLPPEDGGGALLSRPPPLPDDITATATATAAGGLDAVAPDTGAWPPWQATLPESWRRDRPAPRLLPGAGLGLLAHRPVLPRGREAIRDVLWSRLRAGTGWTHLEGPVGAGHPHLLGLTAWRAAELGASAWLLPRQATPRMLVRLICGLSASGERPLRGALVRTGWRLGLPPALTERLAQSPDTSDLQRLISATAGPRLIAVMEPDEALVEVLAGLDEVAILTAGGPGSTPPFAETVLLPPLPDTDIRQMLADLLELEPELAGAVISRASGLPERALGEVLGWASAGLLRPGPRGYTATTDNTADPGDPDLVLAATNTWLRSARQERALPVLEAALVAMDRAGRAATDPTRMKIQRVRVLVMLSIGALDEAEQTCEMLLALPGCPPEIRAVAAGGLADVYTVRNDPERALAVLDAHAPPDVYADSTAQFRANARLTLSRDLDASMAEVTACLPDAHPHTRISLLRQQAILALAMGQPRAAGFIAQALSEAPPNRHHVLRFIRGDINLLIHSDPAAALADYDHALAGYSRSAFNRVLVMLNRGVALLALGRIDEAREAAREGRPLLHRTGHRAHIAVAHALAWATEADPTLATTHGHRARQTAGKHPITARLLAHIEAAVGRALPEESPPT